jgi:hypothetical protein
MLRNLVLGLAVMGSPALATGLEIDVAGQANGTIVYKCQ